jgi:hypothetical protein
MALLQPSTSYCTYYSTCYFRTVLLLLHPYIEDDDDVYNDHKDNDETFDEC